MNGLNVHIENYKAIKGADIELADLTVLAGVNASGKSTIARLFHRLVCIEANYERYVAQMAIEDFVRNVIVPLRKAVQGADYRLYRRLMAFESNVIDQTSKGFFAKIVKLIHHEFEDLSLLPTVQELFSDKRFLEALDRRDGNMLKKPEPVSGIGVKAWVEKSLTECEAWYSRLAERGEDSSVLFLLKKINGDYFDPVQIIFPVVKERPVLRFIDGGVPIIDTTNVKLPFKPIFTPRQSLYIARPSVDFPVVSKSNIVLNGIAYDRPSQDLITSDLRIEELMGGAIDIPKDSPEAVQGGQWQFSFFGNQKIAISECADGMKSMAAILMLDKCGLLQSDSLLIIDEPEVHLHPQWVVEMARVLVQLAKQRKVRVLVTTHSPDMVHALRDFSENNGLGETTKFYLAKEDMEQKGRFNYEDLGMNIGPIFTVFNRAKEQISEIAEYIRGAKA